VKPRLGLPVAIEQDRVHIVLRALLRGWAQESLKWVRPHPEEVVILLKCDALVDLDRAGSS
jgi:hypothetical protein